MPSRAKSHKKPPRIPPAVEGVQVNYCKNVTCPNFQIVPLDVVGRGKFAKRRDNYRRSGSSPARKSQSKVHLWCALCGGTSMLYSNQAIIEELSRLEDRYNQSDGLRCPNNQSNEHAHGDTARRVNVHRFGTTKAGSQRYRCLECGKTFSVAGSATLRQRTPRNNELILELLINKVPMRRICRIAKIRPAVLYNRIKHFHRQCLRFNAAQEAALRAGFRFQALEISIDQQSHFLNWSSQFDRRITQLNVVASADNRSGYILGTHLNHDPRFDPFELDLEARELGDYDLEHAFRRFARLHLPGDAEPTDSRRAAVGANSGDRASTPAGGVLVRIPYLIFGHLFYLRRLLPGVERFRFYLDQDPALRIGCIAAFADAIRDGRADALWVSIDKAMTVDKKRLELARSAQYFTRIQKQEGFESRLAAARALLSRAYEEACESSPNDRLHWIRHPLPHMGEPRKRVCLLTARSDDKTEEIAELMLWASLHAVDRFFMQVRRSMSLLERPIQTASASRRIWYGYSAYNPQVVASLVDIYRVVYNYVLTGQDGRTPAMRLGLCRDSVLLSRILEFV